MRKKLTEAIKRAFSKLRENDGYLFDCPVEEGFEYDARKLHEVCINHRLAKYLSEFLFPVLEPMTDDLFVDIEFNREGINKKELKSNCRKKVVRPDIIIHNRKSGDEKGNILVVECKKSDSSDKGKKADLEKLKAFIKSARYNYQFGLQVIYGKSEIKGTILYPTKEGIKCETIN